MLLYVTRYTVCEGLWSWEWMGALVCSCVYGHFICASIHVHVLKHASKHILLSTQDSGDCAQIRGGSVNRATEDLGQAHTHRNTMSTITTGLKPVDCSNLPRRHQGLRLKLIRPRVCVHPSRFVFQFCLCKWVYSLTVAGTYTCIHLIMRVWCYISMYSIPTCTGPCDYHPMDQKRTTLQYNRQQRGMGVRRRMAKKMVEKERKEVQVVCVWLFLRDLAVLPVCVHVMR